MKIGIDLGGTKIEAIAIDERGQERFRRRVPTPAGDYAATLQAIKNLVEAAEGDLKISGASVGIGIPGAVSPHTKLIKNSNSTCLIGKPFTVDLERLLKREIRLANDANCFTVSEASDGAAIGASVVFGVIIGTGTGGGIVVDQKPLTGANSIAGEWGHNPLPWPLADELPGPECYCGKRGCIETFLSGPALENDYRARAGKILKATDIAASARSGDAVAAKTMERYADRLARALASVVNILDPDVVVLGGGVSNIESLYKSVPEIWGKHIFSDHVKTKLVRAKHGDSSGVRGAAFLW